MSSKPEGTQSSEALRSDFGNTTRERLIAVTKMYEKRLAAQTMADQPLDQFIDDVVKAQQGLITELETRIEELEAERDDRT